MVDGGCWMVDGEYWKLDTNSEYHPRTSSTRSQQQIPGRI